MSSTVSFSGLASGLDTATLIDQLVAIRQAPITNLQRQQTQFKSQITALGKLKDKLLALQKSAQAIDTADEFSALAATSTDENILQVTAGNGAAPGTHDIVVHTLARAQKSVSQGFDSSLSLVGSGTMSITIGETVTDLEVADGTSLRDLADQINNDVEGLHASIVYDGQDTGGYHLVLSGDAGTDGAFTVDASGLSGGTAPTFTVNQTASDATLTVDGVDVTASGNVLDNVISGLVLDLRHADDATTVQVDVAVDESGVTDQIQAFVDAYNDVFSYLQTALAKDGDLEGNATARSVANRVEAVMSSPLSGSSGSISLLAQVGIERDRSSRTLTFDEGAFAEALQANFAAVRDLFVDHGTSDGKAGAIDTIVDQLTSSVDGLFKIGTDSLNRKVDSLDDTIARYQLGVDSYRTTLERKFTAMESQLATLQAQSSYLSSVAFPSYS